MSTDGPHPEGEDEPPPLVALMLDFTAHIVGRLGTAEARRYASLRCVSAETTASGDRRAYCRELLRAVGAVG